MNHYLYPKDYNPSTSTFSFNMHIFIQYAHFRSIDTFSFNIHIFIQHAHFQSMDTFSFNRHLLVYIPQSILYILYIQHKLNQRRNIISLIHSHKKLINKTLLFFFFLETDLVAIPVHLTGQRLVNKQINKPYRHVILLGLN